VRRGFSIIETIFAASILSIVIMVLFNLYPSSLLAVKRAEHRLEATTLVQSILEEKRAGPFTALTALSPETYYNITPPPAGEDGVQLKPKFKVFLVPNTESAWPPKRIVGLQVVVEWRETKKRQEKLVGELWICDVKK